MQENSGQRHVSWLPLVVVCLAQIGTSGDNAVLSFSTNQLLQKLQTSMDQVQLANIVYSLLAGALMVFGGMLGIAKGFKKIFLIGAAFCAIGELLAALTPHMSILVWGARTITGIGAALMIPSVLGIIVSLYQGVNRVLAFGAVGSATGIAVILMPLGAGLIMDSFGYQVAFAVMVGWFVVVLLFGYLMIPSIQPGHLRVDYIGTVFAFVSLVLIIIGCSKISVWGFITPLHAPFLLFGLSPALPLIIAGLLGLIITLVFENYIEKTLHSALIPQSFIRTRQVRAGLYTTGLIFAVLGVCLFMIPSWVMVVSEKSSTQSAIMIVFMALPMSLFSIVLPKKFNHLSPRKIVLAASVSILLGFLAVIFSLRPGGYSPLMYLAMVLCGMGLGGFASQAAMIVASALNPRDAAQSGGVQSSVRNVWLAAGVAIIGAVFLFSMTANFKTQVENSALSAQLKQSIASDKVIQLVSLSNMEARIKSAGIPDHEVKQALALYQQAQVDSGRYAFIAAFILVLLHIPGFLGIQTKGWSEKKQK